MIRKKDIGKFFPYHFPEMANITGRDRREIIYRKFARQNENPQGSNSLGVFTCGEK